MKKYITLNPFKYNEFNLSYQQRTCAMLMESSGVAMSSYDIQLDYIVFAIMDYIEKYGYQDTVFYVNEELKENNIKPIDIIKNFTINMFFENSDTYAEYLPQFTKIDNNLNVTEIVIQFIFDKRKCKDQKQLISSLLYHELNHVIDDINRIKRNYPSLGDILTDPTATVDYVRVIRNITNNNMSLPYIIYRLFVDKK